MHIDDIKNILLNTLCLNKVYVSAYDRHYQIVVVDQVFFGKSKLDQHKIIYAPLMQYIMNNKIHSISVHTFHPEAWKTQRQFYEIKDK